MIIQALLGMVMAFQPTPLSYQVVDVASGRFVATVTADYSAGTSPQLSIICESGCSDRTEYMEEIGDTPLGLFMLTDADNKLITTWASGSAYVVRVYDLRDDGIRKVLEVHSVGSPSIMRSPGGTLRIVVVQYRGNTRTRDRQTWDWADERFVRQP